MAPPPREEDESFFILSSIFAASASRALLAAAAAALASGTSRVVWRGEFGLNASGLCSFAPLVLGGMPPPGFAHFLRDPTPEPIRAARDAAANASAAPPPVVMVANYTPGGYGASSGLSLYALPFADGRIGTAATLRYSVYFPPDFDFAGGAKLPGLHSGPIGECSGGVYADNCFSIRLPWMYNDGQGVRTGAAVRQRAHWVTLTPPPPGPPHTLTYDVPPAPPRPCCLLPRRTRVFLWPP